MIWLVTIYVVIGIVMVVAELKRDPLDRAKMFWRPTMGSILKGILLWPLFLRNYRRPGGTR